MGAPGGEQVPQGPLSQHIAPHCVVTQLNSELLHEEEYLHPPSPVVPQHTEPLHASAASVGYIATTKTMLKTNIDIV